MLDEFGSEVYIYGNPGQGLAQHAFHLDRDDTFRLSLVRSATITAWSSRSIAGLRTAGLEVLPICIAGCVEIMPVFRTRMKSSRPVPVAFRPTRSRVRVLPIVLVPLSSRAWDLDSYLFDSHGNLNVTGPLGTDRPHTVKLYGSYFMPVRYGSRRLLPGPKRRSDEHYRAGRNQIPLFVNGRGDLGRAPVFNRTDLLLAHEVKLGKQNGFVSNSTRRTCSTRRLPSTSTTITTGSGLRVRSSTCVT